MGSSECFNSAVYHNALRLVRNFVLYNSGNLHDVEDVIQEGLYVFFNKLKDNEFELRVKPEYYILKVCKNIWLMELSRRKQLLPVAAFGIDFPDDTGENITSGERKEVLLTLIENNIEKLSPRARLILQKRKDGFSCDQIAIDMGFKNRQMVKDKIYRTKNRLMQLILNDPNYKALKV